MINKQKLLIYSDCYIYGGSERLMAFLIKNPIILEKYQIVFAYRKHKIYQNGINNDFNKQEKKELLFPIWVLSNATLFYKIYLKNYPILFNRLIRIPFLLMDKIGIYFIFNLISHIVTLKIISPDIIHINNGGYPAAKSCNTMVVAAKILRFKYIIYQVNNLAQKRIGLFEKLYDNFINRNVTFFITASKQASEKLAKERNFNFCKIKQIPNTIKDELPTLTRDKILNELTINLTDFVLCTVGFLSKRKGQKYLLEALNIIRQNQPTIINKTRLILVGNGEEEQILKTYVKQHKLSSNVFFVGYQSRSINYINACDVFVLPSIADEDMPLVVLSAMSMGKTIVSTDLAGIREEIENEISGILVSPNTDTISIELANKIIDLFTNRNHLFGKEAKKRFNNLFSPEVYGKSIISLYNTSIQ